MINDIISDSLTRIHNAGIRKLEVTELLHSRVVEVLVGIFQARGYTESLNVIEESKKGFINVVLKYDEKGKSVINKLKGVSKPGRCAYKSKEEIKRFKDGHGTIIVSTSRGILADDEAYKAGVGGEILHTIW